MTNKEVSRAQLERVVGQLFDEITKTQRGLASVQRAQDTKRTVLQPGESIQFVGEDGKPSMQIGGGTGVEYLDGPDPATPETPEVETSDGVVTVITDGYDVDANPAPNDLAHVLVHFSQDPEFEPYTGTRKGSIDHVAGAGQTSVSRHAGIWYVCVQWETLSGKLSDPSDLVEVDVAPPVDADEIEADLEDARQRIQDAREYADQQFEAFDERVESAETDLNDAHDRIDAAEGALSTTQSDLDDAKADITAAQSAADKAIADALAAADLAEGKGQVISQVSAPTGSRARAENLWVRLPDMKVHYYDGDKWKPVLDPDTIAAAQQAADALSRADALRTEHDALQLAVDGEGGLKDRLSTAENTLEDKADSSALTDLDQKLDAIEIPDVSGLASKTELQQGLQDAATDAQNKADAAVTKARETLEAFAHAGDNLIYNGSFEHGWDGWRSPRGEIVEDDDARSGEHILVLGRETGNDYPMTEYVSAEKGHVYLVEYWAKKLPGGTDPRELRLYTQTLLTDGSTPGAYARNEQGAIALADVADMPENEWVKLSATIEVTHDTATGISFGPHILATGTQFHIDVLRAVDVTEAKAALEAAASAQATADEAHEAAGTAQSTADSALTMAGSKSKVTYSESAPAGTASAGDTHRQQNESGDIIGEWEYTDDSWQKRQVSSDAISNLDVGKLTAGTTEVAEGVFGKLWADDVAVNNLQAREGWVGGVNLADGAVTAEKIEATREMITKIMGAEWAYISEQLVVDGELIANNADIISAVIKNLDVTEQSNFNDAFAQKLGTKEFTALVATMARAIIAAPNLIPGVTHLKDGNDGSWPSGFGINTQHPSVWIKGRLTVRTSAPFELVAGEEYHFSVDVQASVPGTAFYIGLIDHETSAEESGYLVSRGEPGTSWTSFEATRKITETKKYRLIFFGSHSIGADNTDGYQWFRNLRLQNMLDGRLTVPGSIDVGKLNVTEEMVASFARILHLVVDQIDVNSLWADQTWQKAGHFGSEDADQQTQVDGTGMLNYRKNEDDELIPAIIIGGGDFSINLYDENGQPVGGISNQGDITAKQIQADHYTLGGRPVFGDLDDDTGDGAIMQSFTQKIAGYGYRNMSSLTKNNTHWGFLEVQARLKAGRSYKIEVPPFLTNTSSSAFLRVRYTLDGSSPNWTSNNLFTNVAASNSSNKTLSGAGVIHADDDCQLRAIVFVNVNSGTVSFASYAAEVSMLVTDLGPTPNSVGLIRDATNTNHDNRPLVSDYSTGWPLGWYQHYRNGSAYDGYTGDNLYQGKIDSGANTIATVWGGYQTTTATVGSATNAELGRTIPQALSGNAALTSGTIRLTGFSTPAAQNTYFRVFWHILNSAPNSLPDADSDDNYIGGTTINHGQTKYFDLPQACLDAFKAGQPVAFSIQAADGNTMPYAAIQNRDDYAGPIVALHYTR